MSERIFYYDLSKDYLGNLNLSSLVEYTNTHLFVNSYFLFKLKQLRVVKYIKVRVEINRADTVAYNEYNGLEELWPYILWFNGISDPYSLKANTILKLFNLNDLQQLIIETQSKQVLQNREEENDS